MRQLRSSTQLNQKTTPINKNMQPNIPKTQQNTLKRKSGIINNIPNNTLSRTPQKRTPINKYGRQPQAQQQQEIQKNSKIGTQLINQRSSPSEEVQEVIQKKRKLDSNNNSKMTQKQVNFRGCSQPLNEKPVTRGKITPNLNQNASVNQSEKENQDKKGCHPLDLSHLYGDRINQDMKIQKKTPILGDLKKTELNNIQNYQNEQKYSLNPFSNISSKPNPSFLPQEPTANFLQIPQQLATQHKETVRGNAKQNCQKSTKDLLRKPAQVQYENNLDFNSQSYAAVDNSKKSQQIRDKIMQLQQELQPLYTYLKPEFQQTIPDFGTNRPTDNNNIPDSKKTPIQQMQQQQQQQQIQKKSRTPIKYQNNQLIQQQQQQNWGKTNNKSVTPTKYRSQTPTRLQIDKNKSQTPVRLDQQQQYQANSMMGNKPTQNTTPVRIMNNIPSSSSLQSRTPTRMQQAKTTPVNSFPSANPSRQRSTTPIRVQQQQKQQNQVLQPRKQGRTPIKTTVNTRNGNNNQQENNTSTTQFNIIKGDWICWHCKNINYGHRKMCNRCLIKFDENQAEFIDPNLPAPAIDLILKSHNNMKRRNTVTPTRTDFSNSNINNKNNKLDHNTLSSNSNTSKSGISKTQEIPNRTTRRTPLKTLATSNTNTNQNKVTPTLFGSNKNTDQNRKNISTASNHQQQFKSYPLQQNLQRRPGSLNYEDASMKNVNQRVTRMNKGSANYLQQQRQQQNSMKVNLLL